MFEQLAALVNLSIDSFVENTMRTAIEIKSWDNDVFDHSEARNTLLRLYQQKKIPDSIFSLLIWRTDVAKDYYDNQAPSGLPIYSIQENPSVLVKYFSDPRNKINFDFLNQLTKEKSSNEEFLAFLIKKLLESQKELFYSNYEIHSSKLSEMLRMIVARTDFDLNRALFYPIPIQNKKDIFCGVIPDFNLIKFVYECLHEFVILKTQNPYYRQVLPVLVLHPLQAMNVAKMHAELQHPVGIATPTNILENADGRQVFNFCFALHDFGFHLYRFYLQSYFEIVSKFYFNVIATFFEQNKLSYPEEYKRFIEEDKNTLSGRCVMHLVDLEDIDFARYVDDYSLVNFRYLHDSTNLNHIYDFYKVVFRFLIKGPRGVRQIEMISDKFNKAMMVSLIKESVKACYTLFPANDFKELIQIIISDNLYNSPKHSMLNADKMCFPVLRIISQLMNEDIESEFSKAINECLVKFKEKNKASDYFTREYIMGRFINMGHVGFLDYFVAEMNADPLEEPFNPRHTYRPR